MTHFLAGACSAAIISAAACTRDGETPAAAAQTGIIRPRTGTSTPPVSPVGPKSCFPHRGLRWHRAERVDYLVAGGLEADCRAARGASPKRSVGRKPFDLMRLPLTRTHLHTFAYIPHSTQPAVAKQHEGVTDIYFITTGSSGRCPQLAHPCGGLRSAIFGLALRDVALGSPAFASGEPFEDAG